jgi:hypothetical protein
MPGPGDPCQTRRRARLGHQDVSGNTGTDPIGRRVMLSIEARF